MKKFLLAAVFVFVVSFAFQSQAAEICFDPAIQGYNMNGESNLVLWGVTGAPNGLTADAKNSWHSELSVASWYALLLKAQEMGKQVGIGYDPVSFEIWYIGHPVTCVSNGQP